MSKRSLENCLNKDLMVSTEIEDIPSPIEDNTTPDIRNDIAKETSEEKKEPHQENAVHQKDNAQEDNQGRSTLISTMNECATEKPELDASEVKSTGQNEIPLNPPNSQPEKIYTIPGTDDNATAFEDEVHIHLSASDELLFNTDLDQFIEQYLPTETRTVNLNNEWIITDTIGNPNFPQLLQGNPNIDVLTFITEKLPF